MKGTPIASRMSHSRLTASIFQGQAITQSGLGMPKWAPTTIVSRPFKGHADWVTSEGWKAHRLRFQEQHNSYLGCGGGCGSFWPFTAHADWVTFVAISYDGKRIVSGSSDKIIRVWVAEILLNYLKGRSIRSWRLYWRAMAGMLS
jgi:WD40 repeat protein